MRPQAAQKYWRISTILAASCVKLKFSILVSFFLSFAMFSMHLLRFLEEEFSSTLFQIFCWSYLACVHIFLAKFLLGARWLITPFKKTFTFRSISPKLSARIKNGKFEEHETAKYLRYMVQNDGAGTWPPRASHGSTWPAAFQPYHDIYLELEKFLACEEVSLDEQENLRKVQVFRAHMQKLLQERVDLTAVKSILFALETKQNHGIQLEDLNGFFACISMSRHAFRYGYSPKS